jgi:hypothetical protein
MKTGSFLLRLALLVGGAGGALVLSEGVYSLSTGRSLLSMLLDRRTGALEMSRERAPTLATRPDRGPWAIDPDPDVGMTMRPNDERLIVGSKTTTDSFGQRIRPGPAVTKRMPRIAVVGDSVAFGYGVADDQTFGHNLELLLAGVVGADSAPPAVFTVACPGWNTRNQVRYLLNHFGRLRPDIVILMPVENDLDDQFRINEEGVRGVAFDPGVAPDRPHVCAEHWVRLCALTAERTPRAEALRRGAHGHIRNSAGYVAETGLTPESRRRWDEVAAVLAELEARLDANGARLLVALRSRNPFETMFDALVRERFPAVPTRTFFAEYGADDSLETDSHPRPEYTRAGAWCLADELLRQGWLTEADPSALAPLSSIAPRYASRVVARRADDEVRAAVRDMQSVWSEFLGSEIDFETGVGFHQVYGGLEDECSVGRHVAFALEANGESRLELRLLRVPGVTRIYPLTLTATFNGVASAARSVPAPTPGDEALTLTFDVPASVRGTTPVDIQIDSSSWGVLNVRPSHLSDDAPQVGLVVQRRRTLVSYYFVGARWLP